MKIKQLIVSSLIACSVVGSISSAFVVGRPAIVVNAATKYQLNASKVELYVGNTFKLNLKGANGKIKWVSEDKSIATVSKSGNVTANKKGKVTIKANYKGKIYRCVIKIKSATLSETNLTLREGYGFALSIGNTLGKVKWSSDNDTVAVVNKNGYISPLAVGKVKIIAKLRNEKYSCQLNVVKAFGAEDFAFVSSLEEFTNFIDYGRKYIGAYCYYDNASANGADNRGIKVGSTKEEFISAYGYCDNFSPVLHYDSYSKLFNNAAYPSTKVDLSWRDSTTQFVYYKTFYFDSAGTVVLIVVHI